MPRVSHGPLAAAAGDGCGHVSGAEIEDGLVVVVGAAAEGELLGGGLAAEGPGEDVVELEQVPRTMPQRRKSSFTTGIIPSTGES